MSDVDPIDAVERALLLAATGAGHYPLDTIDCKEVLERGIAALPALVALREERDHWKGNYAELLGSTVRDDRSHLAGITESYQRGYEEHIEAERALRARVRELERLCETAATFVDYGHDPEDDSKVDNIRAALRAASMGAQT